MLPWVILILGYGSLALLIGILHHLAKKAERDGSWRY